MARKKEPAYITENYTFPSRLSGLMKECKTTQRELAQAVGVRPQTISLYVQGQSFPDVNGLAKIARYFHVSSDYLIGLTNPDNSTADEKLSMVSEYTGLSNTAITKLQEMNNQKDARAWTNMLSCMISDPDFEYLLGILEGYFAEKKTIKGSMALSAVVVNSKDFSVFAASNTLRNILERVGEQFRKQGYLTTDERLDILIEKKMAEAKENGEH